MAPAGITMNERLCTLDTSDPAQVADYERHFYQAYAALTGNTLVRLPARLPAVRRDGAGRDDDPGARNSTSCAGRSATCWLR